MLRFPTQPVFKKTNLTLRQKAVTEEMVSCFEISQAIPKPIPLLKGHTWPPHMTLNWLSLHHSNAPCSCKITLFTKTNLR